MAKCLCVVSLWYSVEDTCAEVESLTVALERPLLRIAVTRPRRTFGLPLKLGDRDAMEWMTDEGMYKVGVKKYMDAAFNTYDPLNPDRRLMETACQAAPCSAARASQTTWHRPVSASVQCEPMQMGEADAQGLLRTGNVSGFLRRVRPLVEQALQQNEAVDIFGDLFAPAAGYDAAAASGKQASTHAPRSSAQHNIQMPTGEDELKELRTFTDLVHSKGKALSAVEWVPRRRGMLAVSPVRNLTFDERAKLSGQVEAAFVLIWDFTDLITPVLKLEAPQEVFCFRFNPTMPNLVVGGTLSGQVVLWDTTTAMEALDRRRKRQNATNRRSASDATAAAAASTVASGALGETAASAEEEEGGGEKERRGGAPSLTPVASSHIDMGHRRLVADLAWLPADVQVNHRGQILPPEHRTQASHQFITVAGDGQCLFWDTRFQDIADGRLTHVARPRGGGGGGDKGGGKEKERPKAPWTPLLRMQLNRLEGVGELSLARLVTQFGSPTEKDGKGQRVDRSSHIMCATEEGEILLADWRARGQGGRDDEGTAAAAAAANDDDSALPEFVKWVGGDKCRPCVSFEKSPFFPAGRWSPTRPATILLGKSDGTIDAYAPTAIMPCSPSRITTMEFLQHVPANAQAQQQQQLLAVGDAAGNLHVFDVPHSMWRPVSNELAIMTSFLERERKRVDYVATRMQARAAEAEAAEAAEMEMGGQAAAAATAAEAAAAAAGCTTDETDAAAMTEAEAAYRQLEAMCIEELELTPQDLAVPPAELEAAAALIRAPSSGNRGIKAL
ncbi:hypothetical protein JKP88DRAFT_287774 [Tribonema minus]|uniref:Uncharacterized protein n=1 Tax=Tribonema minus TaxID=303371 RepID=A0A835Z7V4_9STRA|nr:hypothetical protein JKP88DRAFT_287774 [Tribonema minus]